MDSLFCLLIFEILCGKTQKIISNSQDFSLKKKTLTKAVTQVVRLGRIRRANRTPVPQCIFIPLSGDYGSCGA